MDFMLFGAINVTIAGLLGLLFWITIVPLLVQVMLNGLISMVESVLRMDIRQFLNLLFFPGSLIRMSFLYLTLSLMGWSPSISHGNIVGSNSAMATGRSRKGFMLSMVPRSKRGITLKHVIIIAASSQLAWLLALMMAIYYGPIIIALTYLLGSAAGTWYWLLLFSILFGGMPIPEESMLPLEFMVANYPHWIAGLTVVGLATAIISAIYGPAMGQIWFLLAAAAMVARDRITAQKLGDIDTAIYGDVDIIEEVLLL